MQDLIGRTLGHYRIVEHLGGGGMGVVYRAEDTKLGRTVALKFLPPEWSRDPDARERFLREARAASALEDSRICTIFDIDETDDGQLFIAMAYYEGESLKKRLERGRLPIGGAVDIAIQVAEGLESAHSADILHRDIKPANLMLTGHDETVIVDFGLAKLVGDLTLTTSGTSLGTPHYMSPEQSRGGRLGEGTDLWSLGVVLYEMLTGERPFSGDNPASVARAILDDDPPRLQERCPDAPSEVGALVARALEKDPGRRYQSAGELLADLRRLKNQISEFEGLTLSVSSQSPRRRRSSLVPAMIVIALALFTAGVVSIYRFGGGVEQIDTPPPRFVVLPFENLGPPEDEYFADGMTEEITSRLSAVSGLQVISRTSAMQYKGTDKTIRQIGEELNIQYALEGTVRWERAGEGHGRVRITPQLIHVADDAHLWSDRYDRAIESVFEVQSDIAAQVVRQLHVSLLKPERDALGAKPTDNPEAHEAYLRGRHHYSVSDIDQINLAITMYERAVELDPDFALAWAYLSMRYGWIYFIGVDRTPERASAARRAAERAMEADPNLPDVHRALGMYYYRVERDYERALDQFNRALEIHPDHPRTLGSQAVVLRRMGRWNESVSIHERLLDASPRNSGLASILVTSHLFLRNYERALKYAELAISLAPDGWDGYLSKSSTLARQGHLAESRSVLEDSPVRPVDWGIQLIGYDIAERKYAQALARTRGISGAMYEQALGRKGSGRRALDQCVCHFFLDDQEQARESCGLAREKFEKLVRENPEDPLLRAALGSSYAYLGRKEDAIREGRFATELRPVSEDSLRGPEMVERLARIYLLLNEPEAAIDRIEYLLSIPSRLSVNLLRVHPYWDPLRDHPRFQALLEEYDTK